MKLNRKVKQKWFLSADYLIYKRKGGKLSPLAWNDRIKKLDK